MARDSGNWTTPAVVLAVLLLTSVSPGRIVHAQETGNSTAAPATPEPATSAVDNAAQSAPAKDAAAAGPAVSAPDTGAQPVPDKVPEPPSEILIATWGGAYGEAQQKAVFAPFTLSSGIAIRAVEHTGGAKLLNSISGKSTGWDLADVPYHVAVEACSKGVIAAIEPADIRDPAGNSIDRTDFLPEAISRCAVGTSVWSSLIGYDRTRYPREAPTKLEDFFDTRRFPGKRGLPMRPHYVLEMALMADGVDPARVYPLLDSDIGVARAFARLDTIREQIVWWQSSREPVTLLKQRKVAMAVGFNGRFFTEMAARDTALGLLWDGQIYDMAVWVIPRSTAHLPTALKFISFAVRPDIMARQASLLPYGPTRRSAARQVSKHASLSIDLAVWLPTAPDNFRRALHVDEAWWSKNSTRLIKRFRSWRAASSPDQDAGNGAD